MSPATLPACCSLALTAVVAAGISHWWSVRHFTDLLENGLPATPAPASPPEQLQPVQDLLAAGTSVPAAVETYAASSSKEQKEFFAALVDKMNRVEAQNRDLLDQLAETNHDMMKLQFRVDMNSEGFRPMPLAEEKPAISGNQGTSIDNTPGVLPPRAEPVRLPSYE